MCYYIKAISELSEFAKELSKRAYANTDEYVPAEKVSGFGFPRLPVITQERPNEIQLFKWGLIPAWATDDNALELARMTLNAREDTIFEKPSFRDSIGSKRCVLAINGFYEWRHEGKAKIPYFIALKDKKPLTLGCIYSVWKGQETFSIVTTNANPLMEYIHNTKKRMPLIISREEIDRWIDPNLTKTEIKELMQPFDENDMDAKLVA
jgi:putative SOS response-associated peptidase YedK